MNALHHTYKWVTPHMCITGLFCRISFIGLFCKKDLHTPHRCITSESTACTDTRFSMCHTYEWVTWHIWMGHVTHMNGSRHTYEWVMWHTWMSHVTHMNESCHTHEWVMFHTWMTRCITDMTHMNESCLTHEWVMSHTWMSHVTHMNESRAKRKVPPLTE